MTWRIIVTDDGQSVVATVRIIVTDDGRSVVATVRLRFELGHAPPH